MNQPQPPRAQKPRTIMRFVGRKFLLAFIIMLILAFFNPHLWASNHVRNLHNILMNGSEIETLLTLAEDTEYMQIAWSTRSPVESQGRIRTVPGGAWQRSADIQPIIDAAREFGLQRLLLTNFDGDWYLEGFGEKTDTGTQVRAHLGRPDEVTYPKCTTELKSSGAGLCLRSRWGQWAVVHYWMHAPSFQQ
ncbi:hypothetical protein [Aliidiomarina indica]|uniref:hypothetical protein n=1 Tax=Aliidiomarina indica TaxID=2749147 RepID=UPI00188E6685|nr:hypothetical protein [Aliidiomarina indica]